MYTRADVSAIERDGEHAKRPQQSTNAGTKHRAKLNFHGNNSRRTREFPLAVGTGFTPLNTCTKKRKYNLRRNLLETKKAHIARVLCLRDQFSEGTTSPEIACASCGFVRISRAPRLVLRRQQKAHSCECTKSSTCQRRPRTQRLRQQQIPSVDGPIDSTDRESGGARGGGRGEVLRAHAISYLAPVRLF